MNTPSDPPSGSAGPPSEQVRLSEESFRALVEASPDGFAVHRDGVVVYANHRGLELLGYASASEVVGKTVMSMVHPDDHPSVHERMQALMSGTASLPFTEQRLLRKDGSVIQLEVAGVAVTFDGKPAIASIARDVSDRRRKLADLAHADRIAAVGLLAAGVAHEINNPLTYVMLHLENIARVTKRMPSWLGQEAASFAKAVDEARFGLERVRSITQDLRSFARDDDSGPDLVLVSRVLDIAVNLTAHELKYRAKLVRRGDDGGVYVMGREGKLCQVFVNLFVNAAQALSGASDGQNELVLETTFDDDTVRVSVSDTGPGIPPALLATVFEPFVTTKGTGSGLGLWISRDIVTGHGGQLDVTSAPGKGATFVVSLPRATSRTYVPPENDDEPISSSRRARLLVIDDEEPLLLLLRELLSTAYELEIAKSGVDAQRILMRDKMFDLVLCDVMMPQLSGMQLHAWLENEAPHLASRMLFMSGGDLGSAGWELAEQSPDRFLAKPFSHEQLQDRIERALGRAPLMR